MATVLALLVLLGAAGCRHAGPAEVVVHREDTKHYAIWVIEKPSGVRYLRFDRDGVDQSAVRVDDPNYLEFTYTKAIVGALSLRPAPKRVLIIGLGGGTLPRFLRSHLPLAEIDVVEIDPAVVRVARDHLAFRTDAAMRVHVDDGRRFFEVTQAQWDIVILDAYGANNIPMHLATEEFLEMVSRRIAPGGMVIANLWAQSANIHYSNMVQTYVSAFNTVHGLKGWQSASRILVAFPQDEALTKTSFESAAARLEAAWSLDVDLQRIVRAGYLGPSALPKRGVAITDESLH
ncbi:MAG: spermidine synthase [Myxococcota bacterium]